MWWEGKKCRKDFKDGGKDTKRRVGSDKDKKKRNRKEWDRNMLKRERKRGKEGYKG